MQLVGYQEWKAIFPVNGEESTHYSLQKEAWDQIQAIYQIDFEIEAIFDKEGCSLLFKELYYDSSSATLRIGGQYLLLKQSQKGYLLGHYFMGDYLTGDKYIVTLADFIDQFYLIGGIRLEWQETIYSNMEKLKEILLDPKPNSQSDLTLPSSPANTTSEQ